MVEIGYFNFNVNLTTHSAQACKNNLRRIEKRIKLIFLTQKNVLMFILTPLVKFTAIFVKTFDIDKCLVIVLVMNNQLSHIFSSYVDSKAQDAFSIYNIIVTN